MRSFLALVSFLSVAAAPSTGANDDIHDKALARSLQDKIFNYFRQTQKAHKRRIQTTELGVKICSLFDVFASDLEADGIACSCSSDSVFFTVDCTLTDNIDPKRLSSPEYGSIDEFETTLTASLATGETTTTTCVIFGGDYVVEQVQGDQFCIKTTFTPNLEDISNASDLETFLNASCDASINDDPCLCEFCDNLSGITLSCVVDGNEVSMDCSGEYMGNGMTEEGGGGFNDTVGSITSSIDQTLAVPKFSEQDGAAVDGGSNQSDSDSSSNVISPANVRLLESILAVVFVFTLF